MDNLMENRLKQLREYLNMTQQQMANILGVGQNTYSRIENGVTAFKDSYKKTLELKYHLTVGWLSGADVPMFNQGDAVAGIIKTYSPVSNKEQLQQQILDKLVEQEINPQKSFTSGVPYYDVDFIAGFDLLFDDNRYRPEYLIDFRQYNDATCWCNVTGHSMEPEIAHGDIIALKKVEDKSFFPFGEIYAIVTTNNLRTIKRIGPSDIPDTYSLIPTNKSPEYGIQEIHKDKIRYLFQVLGCMKRL